MSSNQSFEKVGECLYRNSSSGTYYALVKVQGKQIRQSLETKDIQQARRKLRDFRSGIERLDRDNSKNTLAYYADAFLAGSPSKSYKAQKNKQRVVGMIKTQWPGGANVRIGDVKASQIREFMTTVASDAGWSYYNSILGIVRNCFLAAFEDKAILEIPGERSKKTDSVWKRKAVKDAKKLVPSIEEFRRIVASIREQEFADTAAESADFVEAEGVLGLGQAELGSLLWADIQKDVIQIVRVKTGRPFEIPIYPQARELIERRRKLTGQSPANPVFKIKDAKSAVANACKRLDLPSYTQRDFRRMFITEALRRGVNVKIVASLQGHRDGGKLILKTYSADVDRAERSNAAEKIAEAFAGGKEAA